MAQDNEHVQKLIAARDREVMHRRDIAKALAEKHNRGDAENMERIAKDIRIVRFKLAKKFDESDDELRRGYEAYFGEEGITAE